MTEIDNIKDKVFKALKDNKLASLATANKLGEPHSALVFFVADSEFNFYFITKANTKKVENITENNRVAMSIGQRPPIYIQLAGKAELIVDPELRGEKMNELAKVGADIAEIWPPILRMLNETEYLLYKIIPNHLQVLDIERKVITEESYPFVKIV